MYQCADGDGNPLRLRDVAVVEARGRGPQPVDVLPDQLVEFSVAARGRAGQSGQEQTPTQSSSRARVIPT